MYRCPLLSEDVEYEQWPKQIPSEQIWCALSCHRSNALDDVPECSIFWKHDAHCKQKE